MAHLILEVPRIIVPHLHDLLPRATAIANSDKNDDILYFNNTNPVKHVLINGNTNQSTFKHVLINDNTNQDLFKGATPTLI